MFELFNNFLNYLKSMKFFLDNIDYNLKFK